MDQTLSPQLELPARPERVLRMERSQSRNGQLKPLNDFVLMEELPYEPYHQYKQYSKIIVPEKYEHGPEDRPVRARILAKGAQCRESLLQKGVVVLLGKWSGARVKWQDRMLILVKESDILSLIT